ncbi:MAG TPA: NnrS family protein [Ferrovibrio sp.]|uniref:NnrS family protein n=1 Tax=Ferrovibrio sp. TaxID=1917215 RepID=UPI002ED0B3A1
MGMAAPLTQTPDPSAARRWAPFALGFRPFYLGGAAWALLTLPLWLAFLAGHLDLPMADPLAWHAHEMLFGFAAAIIAGFLFTAVRNWTGNETPRGACLAALAALWLAGRVLLLAAPGWPAAVVDLAFLPAIAIAIARPILAMTPPKGKGRPWMPVVILSLLTFANLLLHLGMQGVLENGRALGQSVALGAVAMLIAIIAGRIVPSFTMTAAQVIVPVAKGRDRAALWALGIAIALDVAAQLIAVPALLLAAANGVAALLHFARLQQWRSHRALRIPLLAILHIAYFWLPLAFALRALAALDLVPPAMAVHALGIGAMAGMMLAMMTRSALGHTGRKLKAGPIEIAVYAAIMLAALLRLCAALHAEWQMPLLSAAGLAWEAAFGLFLLRYAPILLRPRIDGRPG